MLCELEPVCLAEQQFCVRFFHLAASEAAHQISQVSTNMGAPGSLVKSASEELLLTSQKKE